MSSSLRKHARVACCYTSPHRASGRHSLHRFGRLRDVDVTGVEPSPRGAELGATPEELLARLRPDEPVTFAHKEELFKAVSSFESPYFRVPKIMEKDQAD